MTSVTTNSTPDSKFEYRGERLTPVITSILLKPKITDWYCSNEIRSNLGEDTGEEDSDNRRYKSFDREYVIRIFATTKRGTDRN